jgi:membrane protease YdiL (CAAX protease family)
MKIFEEAKNQWLAIKNARFDQQPYWGYEDIGAFFLLIMSLRPILRLLARAHLLSQSAITNPSMGLKSAVVMFLGAGLYSVLRFRYRQPVLKPLGWVVPQIIHIVIALIVGPSLAAGITLYLRLRNQSTPPIPMYDLLLLGLLFGPILEESFFRGCLLPLLAQAAGNSAAVIITAFLFALFHGPANLAHWVSLTATGVAYGWLRIASRSTTAAALMHSGYNLTLFLLAGLS